MEGCRIEWCNRRRLLHHRSALEWSYLLFAMEVEGGADVVGFVSNEGRV